MDIFDLYNDFNGLVNSFQGGSFPFQESFVRNVNVIMFDVWNRETRNARKSQESRDNVIAFLVSKNIIIPKNNFARYSLIKIKDNPFFKDYGRFSSTRIVLIRTTDKIEITIPDKSINNGECWNGRKSIVTQIPPQKEITSISEISIELINDDQWSGCLQHLTKYPKLSSPKMVQIDGGFQIAPKEISVVVFSYYKMPAPIVATTTHTSGDNQFGEGDEVVYTATPASQILLPLNLKNEFLWRLGTIYGYYTRDQFTALFGNQKEKMK